MKACDCKGSLFAVTEKIPNARESNLLGNQIFLALVIVHKTGGIYFGEVYNEVAIIS